MKIISIVVAAFSKGLWKKHEEINFHTVQHYDDNTPSPFFEKHTILKPYLHFLIGSCSSPGSMIE